MHTNVPMSSDARGLRIAIATSRYHHEITQALLVGARQAFVAAGGEEDALVLVEAPGSFELITIAHALAGRTDLDAVVCLGCILEGETTHDKYLCEAVANGFAAITAASGKPIAFGILTCQTVEQAVARAGGGGSKAKGNKGKEAMDAAIISAQAVRTIATLPLGRPA